MPGLLTARGTQLVDGLGRTVLLRGVNAGGRSKLPPFLPFDVGPDGFDATLARYVARVVGWGMNAVRLPFTWEAFEPTRGAFNTTHLDHYLAMVRAFSDAGIHVLLDHHQDLFHRNYGGDGFPEFACAGPPSAPPTRTESWFLNYANIPEVAASYDRFWRNDDGIQDGLIALFERLARATRHIPGVLGLEFFNEPAQGTMDAEPWYRDCVVPFYQRAAQRVAAVDARFMHALDLSGVDGLQGQTSMPDPHIHNALFAPHLYTVQTLMAGDYDGDASTVQASARAWAQLGAQWNVPTLVGEFGVPDSLPVGKQRAFLADVYAALDAQKLHATVWEYSDAVEEWNEEKLSLVRHGKERALLPGVVVRPYPRAVSGTLHAVQWDGAMLRLTLLGADANVPCEVWWPVARVDANVPHTWDASRQVVTFQARGDAEIFISG